MAGTRLAATAVLLLLLCWSTHEADAQVTVVITVSRTDPPGFVPSDPFEFRAASGLQVFTCTANGGSGSGNYDYVWTSTCSRGCSFQRTTTGATSVIMRGAVHSGDIGTHTCTASRGGESGSDSITLNVVGYGIHIFRGTSTSSSTAAAGSLPNNGLVIAPSTGDASPGDSNGLFLRIFCRSDSMMDNVGDITGLEDTVISNGHFEIERPQPGEITMVTQAALTSNEQGVYTCRIPDSTNTMRNINIGIYVSGFNTVPTINNPLEFTQGSPSSTLTCTSTGSVATTVTFMRDGATVGPLRDGQSMDFGGVTYQLAQTVTNRAQSTYQNVLTINQPLASIVGSSFTCSVRNTVGTSLPSESLQIMATCDSNPCQNGGTCMTDGSDSFTCDCIAGYTGGVCDVNVDDCESDPCLNGGTCNDEVGSFMCDCISGFTGDTCDVNIDDCEPDPCQNGGTCNDEVSGFMCDCISGFTGDTCDVNIDDCEPDPCLNGGTCNDEVGGFMCDCISGFTGDTCDVNVDDCEPDPCQNGGTCNDEVDGFMCDCISGFTGDVCDVNIDDCEPDPCQNGGTCNDEVGGFMCNCISGFTGDVCDVNVDDCEPDPCLNGGTCNDEVDGFMCDCISGFTGETCDTEVLCSNPVGITNGMVTFDTTSIGSTATYSCDPGYELIGAATTTCTEMVPNPPGFSPQPPVCRLTAPSVAIMPAPGTITAGEPFVFTCTVTLSEADSEQPTIVWTGPVDVSTAPDIMQGTMTQDSGNSFSRTLEFTTVLTAHAGDYTCEGNTSAGTDMETAILTVEIPSPTVTVSGPGGMNFATTELILTCTIEIASALGSVAVTAVWMGPGEMLSGTDPVTGGNNLIYESILTIDSLPTTSSATYACNATVDVMPTNEFITPTTETGMLEIDIVLAPADPVITTPTPQTDSISITWSQAAEDVVVNYRVSYVYSGTCSNVPASSPVTLDGTATSYVVPDLEAFSMYTITVTAINPAGMAAETVTTTTLSTAPDAAPSSVNATVMDSGTILVQWDKVPCLDQNGDITSYMVQYEFGDQSSSVSITGTDRMASLTSLQPFTDYSIQVAAVNSNNDLGPLSTPITEHTPAANIQFRFMNDEIVNNGIVTITAITESEPLLCVTDRIDCCPPEDSGVSNGQWYFPDESAVPEGSEGNFYQTSAFAAVRLHRMNGITNGIYRCDIPDTMGNVRSLHIGIYNVGVGGVSVGIVQFMLTTALTAETPMFTLTCTSSGGPATTVTWERNGVQLMNDSEYSISQVVENTVQAVYSNQLSVTGRLTGSYRCDVDNIRGGSDRTLGIQSTDPPTNVAAVQIGLTSFTVSWTPPNPTPTGYVVFFQGGDDEGSVMVDDGSTTVVTVDGRVNNRQYSITMVALSLHLPSTVTSSVMVMLFQPPTVAITPSPATAIAGESFTLTCTVTLTTGVSGPPAIEWIGLDDNDAGITMGDVTADMGDASIYTRTLTFMLRTSHGGDYTCEATSSAVTGMDSETLTVQIPPPTLAFVRVPDTDVTLRHGDALNLTCTIQFESDDVDSVVTVDGELSGPGLASVNTVTEVSPLMYELTGEVTDLQATTTPDTYTCTVTANPGSSEMNVIASAPQTITEDVTVELLVSISVDRTDPPGFTPADSTEYRAASGPQDVTCSATGGTGSISYRWSSTCNACAFSSSTATTISRASVHSGDIGIHTCTATDIAGRTGSTGVVFNIVGSGIHVFNGAPPTGSQPNNGLVISVDVITGRRFRFFCRSDSLTLNVGELIGLDGSVITTSTNFIGFETPDNGGELRVENTVGPQQVLTAEQQGIYTCRIPLQNEIETIINIGLYPGGFTTVPSITNLTFSPGASSSTLTCTSTGSVATTATFTRDDTTVGPLRDGELIELDGAIFQLTQMVTSRPSSTYESVLTITQDLSDVVGHNYTCTVTNVLGSSNQEQLEVTGIQTMGGDQSLTVGEMNTITCSTSLDISDIVWIDDMDTIVASNSEGVQQLDLVFNPVSDSIHNRMYTCTITSIENLVISETVTVQVRVPRPAITVSVISEGSDTAEDSYVLTCTVMEELEGLTNMPSLLWLNSSDQVVVDGEGITVGQLQQNETTATLVLTFDPVRTSHGGNFTCQGTLESPPGPLMNTSEQTVTVQIPQPTVTVDVPTGPLYAGTNVTLTCNIVLNDQVDSLVIVDVTWSGPGEEITNDTLSGIAESSSPFQSMLTFAPLNSDDAGNYTCEATVSPVEAEFITMSLPGSGTGTVIVQDLPAPQVQITPEGSSTAGSKHTLICRVTSAENLFSSPDVVWMNGTEELDSGNAITVGQAVPEDSVTTRSLTFNPLRTSFGGMYTCMAAINIPDASVAVMNNASTTVNVQIPAPDIAISLRPPIAGTLFILTCTITLDQVVDTPVVVEGNWARNTTFPLDNSRTNINATRRDSEYAYVTTVEINPLSSSMDEDDGDYICEATITPQASEFVTEITADDLQRITVQDLPQPEVTIESMGNETAGEEYQLICTVEVVEGLVVQPTVSWLDPTNQPASQPNITVGTAQRNGVNTTLTLTFTPLRTSHMGQYTCQAIVNIQEVFIDVMGMQTFGVVVAIPPPNVTVTSSRPDPLYEGTQFFLTCSILLDKSVDVEVDVATTWSNSSGVISNTTRTLPSSVQPTAAEFAYSATLTFDPLQLSDTDDYTCSVTVNITSDFIESGESMSMEGVSVLDLPSPMVSIMVSDANPSAGEVYTLICTATVVENLVVMPMLTWIDSLNGAVPGMQEDDGITSTRTLMFDPLRTQQGGVYTCRAVINIDAISLERSADSSQSVIVQIPQPTLAIAPNLQPAYNGTNFSLTCIITLNDAVDTAVSVEGMWMKGSDILQTSGDSCIEVSNTTAVDSTYEVTLSFNPLGNETRDGGDYTCNATVEAQPDSANAQFVRGNTGLREYELLVDALPIPVVTFSGTPGNAMLNQMYTLTCSVEVVEGLAVTPVVTWMNADNTPLTGNMVEEETIGTVTTRDLVFSPLSEAGLREYVCEGCVTISKVFIDEHCGQTRPCIATETPNIDTVSCTSTSGTALSVEWTEATATRDACDRDGGAVDITTYEVDVLQHVQNGNTLSTVSFNEMEYPRDVDIAQLETSVTGLEPGVPYQMRVRAASLGGFGSPAIENCFSRQLEPSQGLQNVTANRLNATAMNVSWIPLTLVQARGFFRTRINYQPQGNRKRQSGTVDVDGRQGSVIINGLTSGVAYDVSAVPFNIESGQQLLGPSRTVTAEAEPSSSSIAAIIGAVIGVVIAVIVVAVIIVVVIYCYRSRRHVKVSLKTERMFELTEKGKPFEDSSIRHLVPPPATAELASVEQSLDAEPQPAPVPSVEVTDRMKPITAISFRDHVHEMHDERDKRFEAEYQSLGSDPVAPHEVAKRPYNRPKNRFANIFPYDHSRVKLKEIGGEEGSTYINACFLNGHNRENAYIASQGPMPNTISDFWRMIWEYKLQNIVMLTKCMEAGRRKCEQYWADNMGDDYETPDKKIVITTTSVMPFADFDIRTFSVKRTDKPDAKPLSVTQYHFTAWPDHGVPKFATSLITFIRRVQRGHNKDDGFPLLVHCSAGVGRTGTFILLDSMLERIKAENSVNVYEFLYNMRSKRVLMVQTLPQYVFIHDALDELITCGETDISASSLRVKVNRMQKTIPGKGITGFAEQFQLLDQVSRKPEEGDCSDALEHYNLAKNRNPKRVPYNMSRARLRPTGEDGSEYINASFVDGYKRRNAYIATQAPLPNTVNDFWKMMWEFKSRTIVMLCNMVEEGAETCHPYWPSKENETAKYGSIVVTLQSKAAYGDFSVRKFSIHDERGAASDGFVVTLFHHTEWPEHSKPASCTSLIEMIDILTKTQMNTGNRSITVMCNDAVGRTGTFICLHAQLERLKTEGVVDFFQYIKSARVHRAWLVPEVFQYAFCHEVLADYIDTFDNYANFKDMV